MALILSTRKMTWFMTREEYRGGIRLSSSLPVDFSLLINLIEDGVEFRMVSARPEVRILSPRLFPVS